MDTEPSWHALTISGQPGKGTAHQRKKDVVLACKELRIAQKKKKKHGRRKHVIIYVGQSFVKIVSMLGQNDSVFLRIFIF